MKVRWDWRRGGAAKRKMKIFWKTRNDQGMLSSPEGLRHSLTRQFQEARGIFSGSSRIIKIKRRFQGRMLCYLWGLKLSGNSRRIMSQSSSLVWIVCLSTFGTDSAVALYSLRRDQRSRTFPRVPQHSQDKVQILQYSKLLLSSPPLFQQGTVRAHTDVSMLPLISNHPKYTPLILGYSYPSSSSYLRSSLLWKAFPYL